jgi:hypothetical protein
MASPGNGVTVPPELCRVVARLAVLGLAEVSRRDGGLRPAAGLADLLTRLDMSAPRRAPDPMGSANSPLAGSTPLLGSGWLTVSEAAAVIGTSPRQIQRLAGGRLRARRTGHVWLIDSDSAGSYARERAIAS